jgi:4-amino-4-deoxy-L-arabinose transferase-like glycosyltransferase
VLYVAADLPRHALDDVDGLYTVVARGMVVRHDWVTPYADGVRFLDKPPLLYWVMGGAYLVFGSSGFAGRLPLIAAVLGTAALLASAAARAGKRAAGAQGALCFGLCVGTFLFTRTTQPDTLLVFFEALAFWAFAEWNREPRTAPALLFYAALAGGMLSKGLIGVVLPLGGVVLFLLWVRGLRSLLRLEPWRGPLLFLVLVVPWFVAAALRNPGFLYHFFVEEHLLRFFGAREPHDYTSVSLPLFWGLILVWLLPWTPLLPAVVGLVRREPGELVKLNAAWALFGLGFFSLSSRIEHYAFVLLPPLGLLLGVVLDRFVDHGEARRGVVASGALLLGLGLGLVAASFVPLPAAGRPMGTHSTDFGPLFYLPQEIVARLRVLALAAGLGLALGGTAVLVAVRRGRRALATLLLAAVATLLCGLEARALLLCEPSNSSHVFGEALAQIARPGDRVFLMGDFELGNSLLADVDMPLLVFDGKASVLEWGLRFPDAPPREVTRQEFLASFGGRTRVFLLAPAEAAGGLRLPRSYEVLRSAGRVLLSNEP